MPDMPNAAIPAPETETETVLATQPPDRPRSLSRLPVNAKLAANDGKDGSQDAMIANEDDETDDDTDDDQCKDEIDDNVQPQHRKVGIHYHIQTFGDIRAISEPLFESWYYGVLGFGLQIFPINYARM